MKWKLCVDIILFLFVVSTLPKPLMGNCLNLKLSPHMSTHMCIPTNLGKNYPSEPDRYLCAVRCDDYYTLELENGYFPEGDDTINCSEDGNFFWTGHTLVCTRENKRKPCPDNITLPIHLIKKECTIAGDLKAKCNLFCPKGYYLVGEKEIKCNFETGKWGQTEGSSIDSKCVADGGEFSCSGRELLLGMKTVDCKVETQDPNIVGCSLKCTDTNKFVKNESLVFCNKNKKAFEWYLGKAKCSRPRKACPDYPKLNKDVQAFECDAEDGLKSHCRLLCPEGFDMFGESYTTCDFEIGKWVQKTKAVTTVCNLRKTFKEGCDGKSPAPNMTAYYCTTDYGHVNCKLRCNERYELVGDDKIECHGRGYFEFRGKKSTCESIRKACPDHPQLADNLKFKECDAKDGLKTKCNLYCDKGYFLVGETQMQCYFDSGKWGQAEGPFIDSQCEKGDNPPCHECYRKTCRGTGERPICHVLEIDNPGAKPVGSCRCYCKEDKDCRSDSDPLSICKDNVCKYRNYLRGTERDPRFG